MKLQLIHGRKTPDEQLNDWGFNGTPITGIEYIHHTYNTTVTVGFKSLEDCQKAKFITGWQNWASCVLEMDFHEDMVQSTEGYFGDYELSEE